jgi:hypothetical protein
MHSSMDQSSTLLLKACQAIKKEGGKEREKNDGGSDRVIAKNAQIS